MLTTELSAAINQAANVSILDGLARILWRGLAEGHIAEPEATTTASLIDARRLVLRARSPASQPVLPGVVSRRSPRSPDREASLQRRRSLAASGIVPGRLAGRFTTAQLAVLSVVGRECQKAGTCRLPMDAIAALAGTCRTTVRNALRLARALGFVTVQERRQDRARNLPHIIAVVLDEWRQWLKRPRAHITASHVREDSKASKSAAGSTRGMPLEGSRKPVHGKQASGATSGALKASTVSTRLPEPANG